ncbi:MAG: winged helix-turn-helix domain-containing protein [Actinomycetota bacterium]|nr:winged helix-turn-helix domain-containing protein [Actinomycetota bacterium]
MVERRVATDEEAKALASALRLRILRACLDEGRTNKEVAAILGRNPASTLHHVRALVRTGFLEPLPERRGNRGAREIPYRATKKSWRVDTPAAGPLMLETFLEEVSLVPATQVDAIRMALRLPVHEMDELNRRLLQLLEDFANRPDDPEAPAWSVFLVVHPDPNRP